VASCALGTPLLRSDVFTVEQRDRVRDRVLELAEADARVVAGAAVGASAGSAGDRWSDLDLTFGVANDVPVENVLGEWSAQIENEFDAIRLFDVAYQTAIYRVFLLPGCLQLDLSFAPAADFGAHGPRFSLLFGSAVDHPPAPAPLLEELFGQAVHHAVRACFCIDRGRFWQAEVWISALRNHALERACIRRDLEHAYGRGFDQLPADVLVPFEDALVGSLDRDALMRALGTAVAGLLREADDVRKVAERLQPRLGELTN
jgi:hypothetical protein